MATVIHRYVGKDGKLPKPTPEEQKRQAEEHKANAELIRERAEAIRVKRMQAQLVLAKARGDLVPKAMAQAQAGFLLVAFRQKAMNVPEAHARRILNISDYGQARDALRAIMHGLLRELENLPRGVEDGWVDRSEDAAEETPSPKKKK